LLTDSPLAGVNTSIPIDYNCHTYRSVGLDRQRESSIENVTTLRHTISDSAIILKQNSTFSCLATAAFNGSFCFSNRTSSVRKLYHSIHGFYEPLQAIYLFAGFEPPISVSRMYFILSAIEYYTPTMFSSAFIPKSYRDIGSVLTLLAAMPEVLSREGRVVNRISDRKIVATIDAEGLVYLVLSSLATFSSLMIALIYIYRAEKDSRGRVVRVKSEPQYVIDLVANDILGHENCAAPTPSDFGIVLKTDSQGRQKICIGREGVCYQGGTVGGRPKSENIRMR